MNKNIISDELHEKIMTRMKAIPAFHTLNVKIDRISDGECVAVVPHNSAYDGVFKSYHGGMLMTAADSIAVVALMTKVGTEPAFATTDMNIRFLAPCLTDVRVHAKVIKTGKLLCLMHVDLYDMNNKHVAVAQVNYIQLPKMPSR
ncbi:MAG TPA: PaaI family thioesterase [Bacteroidia bacterium]|jgi:uncharacterized protein (TIGR00369 family)|nr:PaaI family thioesterase [Bacteroidia bacterium]